MLSFLAGVLVSLYVKQAAWRILALCLLIGLMAWYAKHFRKKRLFCLLMLLFVVCGSLRTAYVQWQKTVYQQAVAYEGDTQIQGKIYKREIRNEKQIIYINHVILQVCGREYATSPVLVYLSDQTYPIGQTIVLQGNIRRLKKARNDGNYDEEKYYHTLNMDYHFEAGKVLGVYGKASVCRNFLYEIRERIKQVLIECLSKRDAGMIEAMLAGDKQDMDKEVKQSFQQAGVAHILVISGMHISFIGMGIYRIFRKKGNNWTAGAASVLVLWFYVNMIGFGISCERAFTGFVLLTLGRALGRSYDLPTGLAIAVFLMVCRNPYLIENAGLQFSAAAMIGAAVIPKYLCRGRKHSKRIETVLVPVCIQLMTLPLCARYYYEIPVYAVLLNIIIVPMLGLLLVNGIVTTAVAFVSIQAGRIVSIPLAAMLEMMCWLTDKSIHLPAAVQIVGQMPVLRIIVYYLLLAGFAAGWSRIKKKKIRKASVGVAALLLLVFTPASAQRTCTFLDVGQGDGVCIKTENGTNLFIDGGSSDVTKVGYYRILPFLKCNAVRRIDAWFVSHYDSDHVSGLIEVLEENYTVKTLVLPKVSSENENYKRIAALAAERKIPIRYFEQGDELVMGKEKISCIFPQKGYAGGDENAESMILYYQGENLKGIFGGDTGETEEKQVAEAWKHYPVDVLKANHHGSDYSNSSAWLEALSPKYIIVSCAKKNRYGHPGEKAVARMEQTGCELFYTMESGQIAVTGKKGDKSIIECFTKP